DLLHSQGRLDEARDEGELSPTRLHHTGGKTEQQLRVGRDSHRLHRWARTEQRRQHAALERQPALLEPEPKRTGNAVGRRDRRPARTRLTRAGRAEAPAVVLAHPGDSE